MLPVYVRCSRIANSDVKNFWQRLSQFEACFWEAPPKAIAGPERENDPEGLSDRNAAEELRGLAATQAISRLSRDTKRAGEGTRTLDIQLGKLALYQLSYARERFEA